jgi:hypothetical protein
MQRVHSAPDKAVDSSALLHHLLAAHLLVSALRRARWMLPDLRNLPATI